MEETIELEKEEMIYNVLSIGEVTSGPQAVATITGKEPNQILNLVLPRAQDDVKDYENDVTNKPKINNVELTGNKSLEDLGIQPTGNYALSGSSYLKNETYSSTEVDNKVTEINSTIQGNVDAINANKLKTYTTTLSKTSWTLNETTNLYEYNVTKEDITANHYVKVNPASFEDEEKFIGKGKVISYNGGFKVTATESPEEKINVVVVYQLAVDVTPSAETPTTPITPETPTTPENSEVSE